MTRVVYAQQTVSLAGADIECTPKEADIADKLSRNIPVGRHNVSGDLTTHLKNLRKKLPAGWTIKSEYGTGLYELREATE